MAFGTPVSGAVAYTTNNGTSITPAYPTGILTTDLVLLVVGQKPSTANGGTVTTPTGWTLRESLTGQGGYATTLGNGTGNSNVYIYSWNSPVAGQTGNLTVTVATNSISWAQITRVPTSGAAGLTLAFGSADGGQNAVPATSWTLALTNGATATNFKAGDFAFWSFVTAAAAGTVFSAHTITATGATFSATTEVAEAGSTLGNDVGGVSAWATVSSGTSTTAPTVGATLSVTTGIRGPVALVRVREINNYTISADAGSFSLTGQDAGLTADRNFSADAGSFSYTGQDATLTKTTPPKEVNAEAGAFTYTGQDATLTPLKGVSADAGAFDYSGQLATLVAARTVSAAAGSFSYSGQSATLTSTRAVSADAGSFSYSGQQATLVSARTLSADAGSFSYTGQDATLTPTRAVVASSGSFSYAGQDATFVVASSSANAGIFTYTGQDTVLVAARQLSADAGAFSYTGQDATLLSAATLSANSGSFSYSGQPATLTSVRTISANAGSFSYSGQPATLNAVRTLNAEAGAFDLTGQPTLLLYGRALLANAGAFSYAGQAATFITLGVLNAEAGAFGEADPYVDPGYIDPYYATNLTATFLYGRTFNAEAGAFTYTGQPATMIFGRLYPLPSDVRRGVIYGPDGIYVGTMSAGTIYVFDD